jgi:hypothetical protein
MAKQAGLPVTIVRNAPPTELSPFTDYFKGFERVQAVRAVFGDQTEEVLQNLKVGFLSNRYMYMGVADQDGNLRVGTYHLKNSDFKTLYLDVVHELFHVKQFMDDREYFSREHRKYVNGGFNQALYFGSPIEVPAYRHAVNEAKRIGMSYDEIVEYLKMGPVEPRVFTRLLTDVGLERTLVPGPRARLQVRINRDARVALYPFTDYFRGFEQAPAVKALFGGKTGRVLSRLKVEFSGMPVRMITQDEDDGHLQVGTEYLRTGDERLLYTDVLVCLNVMKRISEGGRLPDSDGQPFADNEVFVESYASALKEARLTGLSDADFTDHLMIPRFMMTRADFQRFLKRIGAVKPRG